MTDRDALFAAIRANPDDDTPKLVSADFLDEHGEHAFAEYLRLGTALNRELNPCDHDGWERFRELHESLEHSEDGLSNLFETLSELLSEELDEEPVPQPTDAFRPTPPVPSAQVPAYGFPPPTYSPPPPPAKSRDEQVADWLDGSKFAAPPADMGLRERIQHLEKYGGPTQRLIAQQMKKHLRG